jgi:hypothetical protein
MRFETSILSSGESQEIKVITYSDKDGITVFLSQGYFDQAELLVHCIAVEHDQLGPLIDALQKASDVIK